MPTTLPGIIARLIINKSHDTAQLQVWALELLGVMPAARLAATQMYKLLGVDAEDIDTLLVSISADCLSQSIEEQRGFALTAVNLVEAVGDGCDPQESFEGALRRLSRLVRVPNSPPFGRVQAEETHAH